MNTAVTAMPSSSSDGPQSVQSRRGVTPPGHRMPAVRKRSRRRGGTSRNTPSIRAWTAAHSASRPTLTLNGVPSALSAVM